MSYRSRRLVWQRLSGRVKCATLLGVCLAACERAPVHARVHSSEYAWVTLSTRTCCTGRSLNDIAAVPREVTKGLASIKDLAANLHNILMRSGPVSQLISSAPEGQHPPIQRFGSLSQLCAPYVSRLGVAMGHVDSFSLHTDDGNQVLVTKCCI